MDETKKERQAILMVWVVAICFVLVTFLGAWDYREKLADKPAPAEDFTVRASEPQLSGWLREAMDRNGQEAEADIEIDDLPHSDFSGPDPLCEDSFLRDDIPLSYDLQVALYSAAKEFGVDYELAIEVIRQESNFQNLVGDGGNSIGYFQVQARWWGWLLEEIGVTDLTDPVQNFRAGCAILGHLLGENNIEDALSLYNTGHAGETAYSRAVMGRLE